MRRQNKYYCIDEYDTNISSTATWIDEGEYYYVDEILFAATYIVDDKIQYPPARTLGLTDCDDLSVQFKNTKPPSKPPGKVEQLCE